MRSNMPGNLANGLLSEERGKNYALLSSHSHEEVDQLIISR